MKSFFFIACLCLCVLAPGSAQSTLDSFPQSTIPRYEKIRHQIFFNIDLQSQNFTEVNAVLSRNQYPTLKNYSNRVSLTFLNYREDFPIYSEWGLQFSSYPTTNDTLNNRENKTFLKDFGLSYSLGFVMPTVRDDIKICPFVKANLLYRNLSFITVKADTIGLNNFLKGNVENSNLSSINFVFDVGVGVRTRIFGPLINFTAGYRFEMLHGFGSSSIIALPESEIGGFYLGFNFNFFDRTEKRIESDYFKPTTNRIRTEPF